MEHGSKPARNPVLSAVEGDALVVNLLYMADLGFPLTRTLVKAFAWALAKWYGNEIALKLRPALGNIGGLILRVVILK